MVVEAQSLSRAAIQIGMSQPTLSRQIRELESHFGTTLFTRTAKGLEPTEAGLGLIDDARRMGAAAEALSLKGHGRSQQMSGTVRITASNLTANLLLPQIITALREAEPHIQVELVASDLSQNLLRRDADIAIRNVDPTQGALVARKLGDAPIGLYGARSYLSKHGRPQQIKDLLFHDVIGFDRGEAIIEGLAFNGLHLARDSFPLRSDDQMVGWHLLLAGAGLGFVQDLLGSREAQLEQLEIGLTLPKMPVWLVMHEEVRTSTRIRQVANFLGDSLAHTLRE